MSTSTIPVQAFDLTLFFPFALRSAIDEPLEDTQRGAERLERWVKDIVSAPRYTEAAVWKELDGRYPDPDGDHSATEYAECVYFHPFIRSFLYESKQDRRQTDAQKGKSVRILKRQDVGEASLTAEFFPDGWRSLRLEIRNVHLYLFDTGVGVLSIELELAKNATLTLDELLRLENRLRRLYAPFYESEGSGKGQPGHCLKQLILTRPKSSSPHTQAVTAEFGSHLSDPNSDERKTFQEHIRYIQEDCEPYTVAVWRELLWPLLPHRVKNENEQAKESTCPLRYEQILDERMPILSFIAVEKPREISDGDWMRLTFVDESGDSARWPYSPTFFDPDGLRPYVYDRFWSPTADAPAADWQQTRWLCCSYAMTAVGSSTSDFFMNRDDGARAHVRYHYFKLALIAHFHRASLLRFKQQLAEAVEDLQQSPDSGSERAMDQFAERLRRIQLDLLAFRNMYWFTEVSNQLQGQELFDMLSKHLRSRELFQQVFDEADKAAAIVSANRERKQNERTARLSVLAALFLLIAPIAALFAAEETSPRWYRSVGVFFLSVAGVLAGLCGTKSISAVVDCLNQHRVLRRVGLALAAILVAIACYFYFAGARSKPVETHSPPIPLAEP